jgi:hypothetical protein
MLDYTSAERCSMVSQEKLLKAIEEDIRVCRAGKHTEVDGMARQNLEFNKLIRHLEMVNDAGDDQAKLEVIVQSLETNLAVGRHQHWRELSKA